MALLEHALGYCAEIRGNVLCDDWISPRALDVAEYWNGSTLVALYNANLWDIPVLGVVGDVTVAAGFRRAALGSETLREDWFSRSARMRPPLLQPPRGAALVQPARLPRVWEDWFSRSAWARREKRSSHALGMPLSWSFRRCTRSVGGQAPS